MHNFHLPGSGGTNLPDGEITKFYRASGFAPEVRNWHLARVPKFTVAETTFVTCPYCGKGKDTRSLQMDHVIPVRVYVRYRAYLRIKMYDGLKHDNPRLLIEDWSSDHANLALCCTKCNGAAGDSFPTVEFLKKAAKRVEGSLLSNRLTQLQHDVADINSLPRPKGGVNIRSWVLDGATWSTSTMSTRSSSTVKRTVVPSNRFAPYPVKPKKEVTLEQVNEVERLIINHFAQGRPQWRTTAAALQLEQPTVTVVDKDLRVCFYCMGLFNKQAFHIDHIRPSSDLNGSVAAYNNPKNLIPVCRTCNTAKGNFPLNKIWLDDQIERRIKDKLPGVEAMTDDVPGPYDDWETYALAQRLRVLGF